MRSVQSVQSVVLGSRSVAVSVESYGTPGHAGVTVSPLFSQCSVCSSFLRSRLNCQASKVHGPGTLDAHVEQRRGCVRAVRAPLSIWPVVAMSEAKFQVCVNGGADGIIPMVSPSGVVSVLSHLEYPLSVFGCAIDPSQPVEDQLKEYLSECHGVLTSAGVP